MAGECAAEQLLGGRYALVEVLGHGASGVVWRAHDQLLRRDVAVKEIRFPYLVGPAEGAAFRDAVLREARAAARLNHSGAVTVFDVVEEDDRMPLIVMELVDAPTLAELVEANGSLPPREVAAIGAELLDALDAGHAAGIVHRDVKPRNVMVAESGRVRLADFGVAAVLDDARLTSGNAVVGSPAYMSPEQVTGDHVGRPADIWALGATLYYAVEGRPPYDKGSAIPTMTAIVLEPPRPARRAGPLGPLLEALLVKDPAARPTAAFLRMWLHDLAGGGGTAWSNDPDATTQFEVDDIEVPGPQQPPGGPLAPGPTSPAGPDVVVIPKPVPSEVPPPGPTGPTVPMPSPAPSPAPERQPSPEPAPGPGPTPVPPEQVPVEPGPERFPPTPGPEPVPPEPDADPDPLAVPSEPDPLLVPTEPDPLLVPSEPDPLLVPTEPDPLGAPDEPAARPTSAAAPAANGQGTGTSVAHGPAPTTAAPRTAPTGGGGVAIPGAVGRDRAGRVRRTTGHERRTVGAWLVGAVAALAVVGLIAGLLAGRGGGDGDEASSDPGPGSAAASVPDGWVRYDDPATGFAISHPPGWDVVVDGTLTDFRDPATGAYLRVDHVQPPGPSPEGAWLDFEPRFAADHGGYQRIRIQPTTYAGFPAAIWEYTYGGGGGRLRAVDLGFVTGRYGFALNFQTPEGDWDRLQPVFDGFKASFEAPSS